MKKPMIKPVTPTQKARAPEMYTPKHWGIVSVESFEQVAVTSGGMTYLETKATVTRQDGCRFQTSSTECGGGSRFLGRIG